jgi:hypothetical protein
MTNLSPMRCVLFCICLAVLGPSLRAFTLPPLTGELSGQLLLSGWGDLPEIHWQIRSMPTPTGDNQLVAEFTAHGLKVEWDLQLAQKDGAISWQIRTAEIDLRVWGPPLAAKFGEVAVPTDFGVAGHLKVAGSGTVNGSDLAGILTVTLADGSAWSVQQKWNLNHIDLESQLALASEGALLQTLRLHVSEVQALGFSATQLAVYATGDKLHRLHIRQAGLTMLGGHINLRPFILDPAKPAIDTTADLDGVDLGALAAFVPEALSEAKGQVSGRIAVRWSAKLGTQAGDGSLTVSPDSPASIRLTSTPGFLTQHTTERLQLLPDGFGRLAHWLSVENPAYDTLRRIELGELPLKVEKLQVELYPDGPNGPRSATAVVVAKPADGSAVGLVSFTVNVSGPLDEVLKLGTNENVKFRVDTKP